MPIYEALAFWWVGAAGMASFVIFTLEGVNFILAHADQHLKHPCQIWSSTAAILQKGQLMHTMAAAAHLLIWSTLTVKLLRTAA